MMAEAGDSANLHLTLPQVAKAAPIGEGQLLNSSCVPRARNREFCYRSLLRGLVIEEKEQQRRWLPQQISRSLRPRIREYQEKKLSAVQGTLLATETLASKVQTNTALASQARLHSFNHIF
ncbi:hypothetical protein GR212_35725 [Rhizobium lusitanum]|uniref:Uncharacterized protein n=1 Tax=Rhizobium lusitanum TaxID=293958 RepID=A0A6L9UFV8_9HYPH|nr:hypothetical protein [Rhizobium lusitanum]